MKTRKSILCLLLALCLCLCMVFASCKPEEEPEPPAEENVQGQVHPTDDTGAGLNPVMPNPQLDGQTPRY